MDWSIVHSLNGFLFVPRYDFSSVPTLDRVIVAAGPNDAARQQAVTAWSAIPSRKPAEDIYQKVGSGEGVYDATLQDLARTRNAGLAIGVAHALFYPGDSKFQDAALPVSEVLTALTLSLLGAAVVFGATHVRFSRQVHVRPLRDLAAT